MKSQETDSDITRRYDSDGLNAEMPLRSPCESRPDTIKEALG